MRITAFEFIGLVSRQGIKCDVRRGQLTLTGKEGDMLNKLRAVLRDNPSLAQGVKEHIEGASLMTADEFARECDSAGIVLQIDIWLKTLDMAGGSEKARARLRRILDGDSRLKKELIRNAPIPKYHREKGESVAEYLRRNHANLFLAGILAEGVTDERRILEETRKGYKDMWNGSITVLCPEYRKYHNAPEIKRQREIIIAVLDGAFTYESETAAPEVMRRQS